MDQVLKYENIQQDEITKKVSSNFNHQSDLLINLPIYKRQTWYITNLPSTEQEQPHTEIRSH